MNIESGINRSNEKIPYKKAFFITLIIDSIFNAIASILFIFGIFATVAIVSYIKQQNPEVEPSTGLLWIIRAILFVFFLLIIAILYCRWKGYIHSRYGFIIAYSVFKVLAVVSTLARIIFESSIGSLIGLVYQIITMIISIAFSKELKRMCELKIIP